MRISDWSSDVCSSDLADAAPAAGEEARTAGEAQALTVLIPTAPQKLRTQRIPVQQDDSSIAYVKAAQWVEAPQRLFHRLLSETAAATTSSHVLERAQYLTARGEQPAGQLLELALDEARNHTALVTPAVLLADSRTGST